MIPKKAAVRGAATLGLALLLVPCASAQTAEELLAAHAEALGGRAALEGVKSIRRAGASHFESGFTGPLDGRAEIEIVVGQKVYRASDMGTFSSRSGWDGETAWDQGPMGLRIIEGSEAALLIRTSRPFLSAGVGVPEGATIARADDQEVDGVTYQVVTIDDGQGPGKLTVFLDPDTHLAMRMLQAADLPNLGPTELVQELSDYADHDGILLADKVRVSVPGVFSSETVFDETAVNTELDATHFEVPR